MRPQKVKVYVSRRGDINHASKNIKRRKLKGKEVENLYEKKSGERGVSNTYCKNIVSLSVTEKQYRNLINAPSKAKLQNLRKQDSDEVYAGPHILSYFNSRDIKRRGNAIQLIVWVCAISFWYAIYSCALHRDFCWVT